MAADEVSTQNDGGAPMQMPRFYFDFNLGTILGIGLPLLVAGYSGYSDLQSKVAVLSQKASATERAQDETKQAQAETKVRLDDINDIPIRVKALEEQSKSVNARLDRIADAIASGQDGMRRDLNAVIEPLRKDVAAVGTKVEVLADRIGIRPQPGVLRSMK